MVKGLHAMIHEAGVDDDDIPRLPIGTKHHPGARATRGKHNPLAKASGNLSHGFPKARVSHGANRNFLARTHFPGNCFPAILQLHSLAKRTGFLRSSGTTFASHLWFHDGATPIEVETGPRTAA
jgi:hypothetical protein